LFKEFNELFNLTSTNGYYFLTTPYLILNKQTNIATGDTLNLTKDNLSVFSKSYVMDKKLQVIYLTDINAFELNTENFFVAKKGVIYKNGDGVFEGEVAGSYNSRRFEGSKLVINNKGYQLQKGIVYQGEKQNEKTVKAEILHFFNNADNQLEAVGTVEIETENGKITAQKATLTKQNIFLKNNVKVTNKDMTLTADNGEINNGYSLFFNSRLKKGSKYNAKSDLMVVFKKSGKVVCIGNALFTDNSTGKALGDSLTLNVSADTIKLIGSKTKAKVEFKYEKKTTSK
jgi:lipopolysaccharide export system protein LptA